MDRSKAYSVLGLPQNATEQQVKDAYRNLAQKYNVDHDDDSPLKEEAEHKMAEINEAFDVLMSYLRTGGPEGTTAPGQTTNNAGRYPSIRNLINTGEIDRALAELGQVPHGSSDAEWNFLMGSAYYYKGWLEQALRYFQEAVRLDGSNPEYQAALRNLQASGGGEMPGNPYGSQDGSAQAMNCACNTCTLMCCMDACCGMGRGC